MDKNILNKLFKAFDKENIVTVIYFGNKKGDDIDIFIVTKQNIYYETRIIDNFDITLVGIKYFYYLITVFDPIVTDPILTGNVIYGEKADKTRKYLLSLSSSQDTINHLLDFAQQILEAAKKDFQENKYHSALVNIVFCLSYICFANHYLKNKKVETFKTILTNTKNTLLQKAYKYLKQGQDIKCEKLKSLLTKSENKLMEEIDKISQLSYNNQR